MIEPTAWLTILGFKIYPFGCCLAAAMLLALLLLFLTKSPLPRKALLSFAAWAVPCGLLGARLGYFVLRAGNLLVDFGVGFIWRLDWGGFSLAGGFVGLLFAAWLAAKSAKRRMGEVLNAAAPAMLLFVALERFAECLTTEGIGDYVENVLFQRFPFAVLDVYGDYRVAVFFWEGLTALLLAAALWLNLKRGRSQDTMLRGMLFFGATQIFWESLRRDNFLRFGFVRVNQLFAIALVLAAVGTLLVRGKQRRGVAVATLAGYSLGTLLLVAIEFGLDKSQIPNTILYAVMVVVLCAMMFGGGLLLRFANRNGGRTNEENLGDAVAHRMHANGRCKG